MTDLTPFETITFPENITTVFFDLDGTLFDSMGVWEQIDIDFLAKRGLTPPDNYIAEITPLGFRATAEYTIKRFGLRETPEAIMNEWHEMAVEAYTHHVPLKRNAIPVLDKMASMGYRLVVTSASSKELAYPCMNRNGITSRFEKVLMVDDHLSGKNDPLFWKEAAKTVGVLPEECALFDDSAAALSAAKSIGILTVGVKDIHTVNPFDVESASDIYTSLD